MFSELVRFIRSLPLPSLSFSLSVAHLVSLFLHLSSCIRSQNCSAEASLFWRSLRGILWPSGKRWLQGKGHHSLPWWRDLVRWSAYWLQLCIFVSRPFHTSLSLSVSLSLSLILSITVLFSISSPGTFLRKRTVLQWFSAQSSRTTMTSLSARSSCRWVLAVPCLCAQNGYFCCLEFLSGDRACLGVFVNQRQCLSGDCQLLCDVQVNIRWT